MRVVRCFAAAWFILFAAGTVQAQKALEIKIPTEEGRTVNARMFVPEQGNGPWPGVLVLHTYFGMQFGQAEGHDRAYGQSLAREGFVAIVPDYANFGSRGYVPGVLADLNAVARWFLARPETGGKPIGCVGFSIGGYYCPLVAAHRPESFNAVVGYYGLYNLRTSRATRRLFSENEFPPGPLDVAPRLAAQVLLLHGDNDDEIKVEQANEFHSVLNRSGRKSELVIYPGAYHRFDRGPSDPIMGREQTREGYTYRMNPAARGNAWERTLDWLRSAVRN